MASPLPGFGFAKIHAKPYPAISPTRPELSQAGKTVLITGGHTGIGFAIAQAFAQAGAKTIALVGRRTERVIAAARQLSEEFPALQAAGFTCDVTDQESVDRLWGALIHEGFHVDVLVLSASKVSKPVPILEAGAETVWDDYQTNARAPLDFAVRLNKMPGNKPKVLLNVSTSNIHESVKLPVPIRSYCASKNAGSMLLQMIAEEVSAEDLQIISFHPGSVYTELIENTFGKVEAPWDDAALPGQFAVWAASPEAKFLHGRFVWAKWDVDELSTGPLRERIDTDPRFLKVGVVGIQEWENRKPE